jgi:hypothetical protein
MTFKLTPKQKELAFQLYRTGNALGANLNTVKALLSKGLIEKTNGSAAINYHALCFTAEGRQWAKVQFNQPDPPDTPQEAEPQQSTSNVTMTTRIQWTLAEKQARQQQHKRKKQAKSRDLRSRRSHRPQRARKHANMQRGGKRQFVPVQNNQHRAAAKMRQLTGSSKVVDFAAILKAAYRKPGRAVA